VFLTLCAGPDTDSCFSLGLKFECDFGFYKLLRQQQLISFAYGSILEMIYAKRAQNLQI